MIDTVVIAVPARDEGDRIQQCVAAIDHAAASAGVRSLLVVAADSCADDTAAAARAVPSRHCSLTVVEGRWGRAGAVRRAAVGAGLEIALRDTTAPRVWIANTDADTRVPDGWLRDQLVIAETRHAAAGIVRLDPDRVTPALMSRFVASYPLDGEHHSHVHGANLGVRADVYLAVGGWCPDTEVGEDHVLWHRITSSGADTVQSTAMHVVTSARTRSRVVGGFATTLAATEERVA